jgi:replication factor C small subunit
MSESKLSNKVDPLWIKYQPKSLDEVIGHANIIKQLNNFLEKGYLPNLGFIGNPGTGKTLITNLLAKKYMKGGDLKSSFLTIDASTNNSVDYVREVIVKYLDTVNMGGSDKKILFLDEFDNMSRDAQSTLRRPIEKSFNSALVIVCANYKSQIIDPILSRLTLFDFGALEKEAVDSLVKRIIKSENIKVEGDYDILLNKIYLYGKGDIRFILNNFMEQARASGVLNQSIINLVRMENINFVKNILMGKIDLALELAYKDPRNSFNSSISYVLDSDELKMSKDTRLKLSNMFYEGLRDMTNGIPPNTVVRSVVANIENMVEKSKANKQSTPNKQ